MLRLADNQNPSSGRKEDRKGGKKRTFFQAVYSSMLATLRMSVHGEWWCCPGHRERNPRSRQLPSICRGGSADEASCKSTPRFPGRQVSLPRHALPHRVSASPTLFQQTGMPRQPSQAPCIRVALLKTSSLPGPVEK